MATERKYPHNVLEGFGNGALLDLRVRFAMSLLTHSPIFSGATARPNGAVIAEVALEIADELLTQAEARGWIEPLPGVPEIDADLRDQAKRTAEYQARQQVHGNGVAQRIIAEEQPQVIPAGPRLVPPGRH